MAEKDYIVNLEDLKYVNDKIGDLKSAVKVAGQANETGVETFQLFSAFERGGLNNSGVDTPGDYRIRSKSIVTTTRDLHITVHSGYRIMLYYYINGVFDEKSEWVGSTTDNVDYTIPKNKSFRIVIGKRPEDTSIIANVDAFASSVTFDSYIEERLDSIDDLSVFTENTLNELLSNGDQKFQTSDFARGGLNDGEFGSNSYRVATPNILAYTRDITITVASGYRFDVHLFNNGEYSSKTGWVTSSYTVTKGTQFKIVIGKTPEDTSITADIPMFVNALTITTFISNMATMIDSITGTGNTEYTGDKIIIADDTSKRRCNITVWKKYLASEVDNISNYDLGSVQSMAISNGKVFLLSSNGVCSIIDYDTKLLETYCAFTPSTRQHANSAQFTDIYYDEDDDFPLLLLSRCGNAVTVVQPSDDACLVYRITVSGGVYTMTQINSIVPTFTTYGGSWAVDNVSRKLYLETYTSGNYQTTENNPNRYLVFDLPSKADIMSGTPIELSASDIIAEMYYDHFVEQGATANGGILYSAMAETSKIHHIWAVDVWKNRVASKVRLTAEQEAEGIAIYNGKLYVTQRKGGTTEIDEKLAIYELEF